MLVGSSSTHSRYTRNAHHRGLHDTITDHEHEASTGLDGEYDTVWHEERLAHLQVRTVL